MTALLRDFLPTSAKALFAGLVAGLGALGTVLVGDVGFEDVTAGQWVAVVLAALIAASGVYRIPYKAQG
jgi:hypothetical protein